MQSDVRVDFVLTDPPLLDHNVFDLWRTGVTANDAARVIASAESDFSQSEVQLLSRDVEDSYHMFRVLAEDLDQPAAKLAKQQLFQLSQQDIQFIVDSYYYLDENFAREVAGRKIGSKIRKEVDEISQRTRISLLSCRRQFDNLRCVLRTVMDNPTSNLLEAVRSLFLLSRPLAEKYSHLIFLCYHRFETNKRRLSSLKFADWDYFASVLMKQWTEPSPSDPLGIELSPVFTNELRDLKTLLNKDVLQTYRPLVMGYLTTPLPVVDSKFVVIVRGWLSVGATLSSSTNLRDFFVNLLEQVYAPIRALGLAIAETELLVNALIATFDNVQTLSSRHRQRYAKTWARFLHGMRLCLKPFFQQDTSGA
eukprot:TRINITY_DN502_c0_g2_i1.p1 TRINITY_DN502_c0_g2~~TRINITY_DN502_c0_g2_i1.p1  ORF type:complete len:365 (+),score=39.65 TRINITY_DN502_c0_g2_i1:62-1156(+)